MVAGDAAGFVINTGIKLMGINLAIASGKCAAEAAVLAKSREDYSEATLKEYAALLEPDVLAPMRLHKRAAKLMSSPRLFNQYADMINNVMDQMVTDQGAEQGGLLRVARKEAAAIGLRQVASDALLGVRSL